MNAKQNHSALNLGWLVSQDDTIRVCLEGTDVYRIDRLPEGAEIVAETGTLWVTQSGDGNDYFLQGGQRLTLQRHGKVLVQGLPSGQAKIRLPQ